MARAPRSGGSRKTGSSEAGPHFARLPRFDQILSVPITGAYSAHLPPLPSSSAEALSKKARTVIAVASGLLPVGIGL